MIFGFRCERFPSKRMHGMFKRRRLHIVVALCSFTLLFTMWHDSYSKLKDLKTNLKANLVHLVTPKAATVQSRNISLKRTTLFPESDIKYNNFSTVVLKQPSNYSQNRQNSKTFYPNTGCPNFVNPLSVRRWFPMLSDKGWYELCNKKIQKDPETNLIPIQFDPSFKNPCWYTRYTNRNGTFGKTLHCLPYFFLIGVRKSGTTDLIRRIEAHPEYARPGWKERGFLSGKFLTFNSSSSASLYYSKYFDTAAVKIKRQKTHINGSDYYPAITGDATTENCENSRFWPLWPENKGLKEPRIMNYDLIKRLLPSAKIIIKLRDPIDRFYSDYFDLMKYGKRPPISKAHFHSTVVNQTENLRKCLESAPLRTCVYHIFSSWLEFGVNMYVVFIKDLFRVFPSNQVLVINHDEYIKNIQSHLNTVYNFLGMRPLKGPELKRVAQMSKANVGIKRKTIGPMLNETRQLIYRFMKPYNAELARILKDESFLFLHPDLEDRRIDNRQ